MSEGHEARVKKAIHDASAMVTTLPENLQAAAFSKAFDALMYQGTGAPAKDVAPPAPARTSERKRPAGSTGGGSGEKTTGAATLIRQLNRTEHPGIRDGRKAGDLALFVLRAGRSYEVEWLTPSDISTVLANKFMLKVDPAAIRMALGDSKFVDRRPTGKRNAYEYRLMAPGEAHLDELIATETQKS